ACNPTMKHSKDMNTIHKARFVLVHLLWAYDEDGENFVVDSALSLVEYGLLRFMLPNDETTFREKLIWDTGAREEITSSGVVASRLMGIPVNSRDDLQAQNGNVSYVTFETRDDDPAGPSDQREKVEEMIREERRKDPGGESMEVDEDVGGTHVTSSMTFVAPEVRTAQIPSGASISQSPDDTAWETETGSTSKAEIAMFEIINTILRTSVHINRVDLKRLQRKLLMGAANRDALSIFALRALKPILDNIPGNLQVCPNCHQGVNPGVQICDRCQHVLTTIQSKVEETVKGSLVALVTDAAVACVDNEDEPVEEVDLQRQPMDMSGNVPRRAPIAGANPDVLNITFLARPGAEEYTQVNEPAPLNPGRVAEGGSFAFLRRRKEKAKAIKDETFEDKEARLTQKKFNDALKEVSGNVSKNHGGPANQFIRKVRGEGGPNYPILHSYVTKTRLYMEPK
ncbi:MAG: hypothetical protein QF745_10595, partial [Planctomycetota bacterium]|nr:hypothetical protein [Planctomycetota bacterium]